MDTEHRTLKVFLCHAPADGDRVYALYTHLIHDGVDAWLDKENLIPGQNWELEIRKAVRAADVVVVCISKQFNQEGFQQKEVRLALDAAMGKPEEEIFIIPARLEECDTLESLGKWHWVNLFEQDGYKRLMIALRAHADKIGITLQLKRGWLPIATSPLASEKKPIEPESQYANKIGEKGTRTPKPKAEKSKSSKAIKQRINIVVVALISLVVIAGLLSSQVFKKWFSTAPLFLHKHLSQSILILKTLYLH